MTTVLRLVTPGPPVRKQFSFPRHLYVCSCPACVHDRATRKPAQCECTRPAHYVDPTSGHTPNCLRCGRPPA